MAHSTAAGCSGKHTPGPCVAISRHNGTVNIETKSGVILGMSSKTDRLTHEEVRYNATLWAAATDLLLQLEALVVQIESVPDLCVPPGVRKAIAKARAGSTLTHLLVALVAAAVATYTILAGLQ